MAIGQAQFAAAVLKGIGAPVTHGNVAGFIGWSRAEGGSNWQRNNPLNTTLDAGVGFLPLLNFGKHLTIHKLDVYSLLHQIAATPSNYGLVNATDSSQGMIFVDPDQYLFWDDLHPTTRGHNLLGQAARETIEPKGCLVEVSASPLEYVGSPAPGCR